MFVIIPILDNVIAVIDELISSPVRRAITLPYGRVGRNKNAARRHQVMEVIERHVHSFFVQALQLDARTLKLEAI